MTSGGQAAIEVFVDGDACPVRDETYLVASRYGVPVCVVANSRLRVPDDLGVELVVVDGDFDAADDWIVDAVREDDVVVTADIPLAARCLERGAHVLGPLGEPFRRESIGNALAMRELHGQLRESGALRGGARPIAARDRSRFLSRLDEIVQRALRSAAARDPG